MIRNAMGEKANEECKLEWARAIVPGRASLSPSLSPSALFLLSPAIGQATSRVINLATSSRAYGNSFSSVLFSVVKRSRANSRNNGKFMKCRKSKLKLMENNKKCGHEPSKGSERVRERKTLYLVARWI